MTDLKYPIEIVNGVPVVAAPAEIDISNADRLDAVLREAAARGHERLVVDMTGTQFCDSAGLGALVRAHNRALADGGELRLVRPTSASVLRVFALTGIDQVIPNFPSLCEAVEPAPATAPPATTRPRHQHQPGLTVTPLQCPARAAADTTPAESTGKRAAPPARPTCI